MNKNYYLLALLFGFFSLGFYAFKTRAVESKSEHRQEIAQSTVHEKVPNKKETKDFMSKSSLNKDAETKKLIRSNSKQKRGADIALKKAKSSSQKPHYNKRDYTDNWELEKIDESAENLKELMTHSQPLSIVRHTADNSTEIFPNRHEEGEAQSNQTMYLGSSSSIDKVKAERQQESDKARSAFKVEGRADRPDAKSGALKLEENAFDIVAFHAGTRNNGTILVPVNADLYSALQGPNYSFEEYDFNDPEQIKLHFSTVLPLGNNGTLILKVKNNGVLINKPGFDISIYQTTFRIQDSDSFSQKFAYLGVSNKLDESDVHWFPCAQNTGFLSGCIGVVPTKEGGDKFDLSTIGVQSAQYIWIRDVGSNNTLPSKWPNEGCVIDAVHLHHAFKNEPQSP